MATATRKYTCAAASSGMPSQVTSASDSTDLTAGIDVSVFVAKTTTNKNQIVNALEAIINKITTETAP
jgi:hypothetical protein